jgi:hypothetical protein
MADSPRSLLQKTKIGANDRSKRERSEVRGNENASAWRVFESTSNIETDRRRSRSVTKPANVEGITLAGVGQPFIQDPEQ